MKKMIIGLILAAGVASASYLYWAQTVHAPEASPEVSEETAVAQLDDLIVLASPLSGATVASPLHLTGEARGTWFFEASFPVIVVDWDGLIIGEGIATAQSDWMTEDYVPFTADITFTVDPKVYSTAGAIILQKDNPSGLPEFDAALEVPVVFAL